MRGRKTEEKRRGEGEKRERGKSGGSGHGLGGGGVSGDFMAVCVFNNNKYINIYIHT